MPSTVTLLLENELTNPVPNVLCQVKSLADALIAWDMTNGSGVSVFSLADDTYNVYYGPTAAYAFTNPYVLVVSGATSETYACVTVAASANAGLTFAELRGLLESNLHRRNMDPLPTQVAFWIQQAHLRVDNLLRWTRAQVTKQTAAENETITIDGQNILSIVRVSYDDKSASTIRSLAPLSVGQYQEKYASLATSGTPLYYMVWGRTLWLYPTPNTSDDDVVIWVTTEPTELNLDGDVPSLPNVYHQSILEQALVFAYRDFGYLPEAAGHEAVLMAALQQLAGRLMVDTNTGKGIDARGV